MLQELRCLQQYCIRNSMIRLMRYMYRQIHGLGACMGCWHGIHRWAFAEECWFENFLPRSHSPPAGCRSPTPPRHCISSFHPHLRSFFLLFLYPKSPECPQLYPRKGTLKTSSCRPKTYPAHSNGHAPLPALLPHPLARPQKEQLPKIHSLQVQTPDVCSTISLRITAVW